MTADYGQLRAWLLKRMMTDCLKPVEVADLLDQLPIESPRLKGEVRAEAERYRTMGDTWK